MVWHAPFDLYYWFVNVFAGSLTIFLAISFLVIAAMTGMFRMPPIITGLMFFLFIVMLSIITGTVFVLAMLILGLIVGWSVMRLFR